MTITINGIECGLHFGTRSVKTYSNAHFEDGENATEIDNYAQVLYAGMENYFYMQNRRPGGLPVTFAQIYTEVESIVNDPERVKSLHEIIAAFMGSQTVKNIQAQIAQSTAGESEEDLKKKDQSSGGKKSRRKRSEKSA